ncbi:helix-turn-helix transcriptional regulator [Marilutibacter aestuarii]|uniref:helix-turn-helix transcriptional regulator n=1 Tax=Marilutibacter aestuarii TaxID=1706195 RepID=UPI0014772FEB|nr:AraC family transcriptional regulator [Lysobacter aestuarii]
MPACDPLPHGDAHATGGLDPRAFERVNRFIGDHLGERFSLAELAATACISRFHFARLFRQRTGTSPMAYVMRLRVERAKVLLAEGDRCIATTAADLGFFDQSHFTRTFRRATGVPPRAFSRLKRHGTSRSEPRLPDCVPSCTPRRAHDE